MNLLILLKNTDKEHKGLEIKECQSCFTQTKLGLNQNGNQSNGKLQKCDKYVFDKLYYEKTLVEKVKIV